MAAERLAKPEDKGGRNEGENGQLGSGDYEEELIQYGEMLTLLEEQQEMIINRSADGLIQKSTAIHSQMAEIAKVRDKRDEQRRFSQRTGSGRRYFFDLIGFLPSEYQSLTQALLDEVNGLLQKANQRMRQNHLLLSRSLDFMQQLIQSLFPTQAGQTTIKAAR